MNVAAHPLTDPVLIDNLEHLFSRCLDGPPAEEPGDEMMDAAVAATVAAADTAHLHPFAPRDTAPRPCSTAGLTPGERAMDRGMTARISELRCSGEPDQHALAQALWCCKENYKERREQWWRHKLMPHRRGPSMCRTIACLFCRRWIRKG